MTAPELDLAAVKARIVGATELDAELIQSFVRRSIPCDCGGWSERFDGVNILSRGKGTVRVEPTSIILKGRENHARACEKREGDRLEQAEREVERLREALKTLEAAWSVCDDERQEGFAEIERLRGVMAAVEVELARSFSMSVVSSDPHRAWRDAAAYVRDSIRLAILGASS